MMESVTVRISLFAMLREKYGVKELQVECDGTVRNLLENAAKVLGESFFTKIYDVNQNKVREDLIFSINGRNIKDLKGESKIKDGDKVSIFPAIAGG